MRFRFPNEYAKPLMFYTKRHVHRQGMHKGRKLKPVFLRKSGPNRLSQVCFQNKSSKKNKYVDNF